MLRSFVHAFALRETFFCESIEPLLLLLLLLYTRISLYIYVSCKARTYTHAHTDTFTSCTDIHWRGPLSPFSRRALCTRAASISCLQPSVERSHPRDATSPTRAIPCQTDRPDAVTSRHCTGVNAVVFSKISVIAESVPVCKRV